MNLIIVIHILIKLFNGLKNLNQYFKDRDNKMYKRICDITDNHIIQINYDNIVNEIEKILNDIINEQN